MKAKIKVPDKIYVEVTDLGFVGRSALCQQGGMQEFISRSAVERIINSSTTKRDALEQIDSLEDYIPKPR